MDTTHAPCPTPAKPAEYNENLENYCKRHLGENWRIEIYIASMGPQSRTIEEGRQRECNVDQSWLNFLSTALQQVKGGKTKNDVEDFLCSEQNPRKLPRQEASLIAQTFFEALSGQCRAEGTAIKVNQAVNEIV